MKPSFNEVEAHAKKALRGVGYAWGLAEDGAQAIRILHQAHWPALEALYHWLKIKDANHPAINEDPIWQGCHLLDLGLTTSASNLKIHQPLLLAGFIAQIPCSRNQAWGLNFGESCLITLQPWQNSTCWKPNDKPVTVSINQRPLTKQAPLPKTRLSVSETLWQAINTYVHRTYVPNTPESRRGAGPS